MRRACLTPYRGELLSMRQLEKRLHIGYDTIARWRRTGRLCEATIAAWLARRSIQPTYNALPPSKLRRIRRHLADGEKHEWIAYDVGCSRSTVTLIANGKRRRAA